jgi:predicted dehydrogenase
MASPALGIGIVGHSFMGEVHSQAWHTAPRFYDLPRTPVLAALAGRDAGRAATAAERLGWAASTDDWRALIDRDDVEVIDICTPGDTHAEIAIAALEAGKHVLCEKPLANTVDEAETMTAAAESARAAGVRSMVGFNYRRVPAVACARRLVADGRLGTIRHVRATYLQDWITDPSFPLVWRLDAARAGSGALGDIGAHIVDLTQFIVGETLTGVAGTTETFVKERPLPEGTSAGLASTAADGTAMGEVTVDDAAVFFGRFASGALASYEASRFATGRKNALGLEINGSGGSLRFDFEAMNELWFYDNALDDVEGGFRRILVTETEHPYMDAWWPPGHVLGYEHTFTHEIRDFVTAVGEGTDPQPSFADGLQVQRVLAAVLDSAGNGSCWTPIGG